MRESLYIYLAQLRHHQEKYSLYLVLFFWQLTPVHEVRKAIVKTFKILKLKASVQSMCAPWLAGIVHSSLVVPHDGPR